MMLAASRLAPLRGTVGKLPVHPAPRYSPLLSNVYLHYVFDLWIKWWRESRCCGEVIVVRYADDYVIGFEHRAEAEACLEALRARFAKFGLKLHDGKTRCKHLPQPQIIHPYPEQRFRARLKAGAV